MNEIENSIGVNALARWRDSQRATLLIAPRGEVMLVALVGDGGVFGRRSISPAQLADVIAEYTRFWQSVTNGPATTKAHLPRSLVTTVSSPVQGVDTGIPPKPPGPPGIPDGDFSLPGPQFIPQEMLHSAAEIFANATAAEHGAPLG